MRNYVEFDVGEDLTEEQKLLFVESINGPILAIRLYSAQGTTRAKIKTTGTEYLVDWANKSQRDLFLARIRSTTIFYDERHKELFCEV